MTLCVVQPSWLGELTQLEHLRLADVIRPLNGQQVEEALSPLQRLRSLVLYFEDLGDAVVPPDPPLPSGAWLRGLRQLGVTTATLLGSAAALPGAASLQQLCVIQEPMKEHECAEQCRWLEMCRWLGCHPPLNSVQLIADPQARLPPFLQGELLKLKDHRPQLHVGSMQSSRPDLHCFPEWFPAD